MSINVSLLPRKTSPAGEITEFISDDLVSALQKIDDSKRKVLISGLKYDLRTIAIEEIIGSHGDPNTISLHLNQYGSADAETIEHTELTSALALAHKSKSSFPILGSKYDLRTLQISII